MKTNGSPAKPRFVVLFHQVPLDSPRQDHWDLMLESDGVLETWALDSEPSAGRTISAKRLVEHRLAYLEFEGEISGGRGSVRRIWKGTFLGKLNFSNRRSGFQLGLDRELESESRRIQVRFQELVEDDWIIEFQ